MDCSLSHTRGTQWQGWPVLLRCPVRATSKASSVSGPAVSRWGVGGRQWSRSSAKAHGRQALRNCRNTRPQGFSLLALYGFLRGHLRWAQEQQAPSTLDSKAELGGGHRRLRRASTRRAGVVRIELPVMNHDPRPLLLARSDSASGREPSRGIKAPDVVS